MFGLKPQVANAPTVARQVFERIQPVEMIDRKLCHCLWRRQTKVDRHATAPVGFEAKPAPTQHAATGRTEANFKGGVGFGSARVSGGRAMKVNALALIVVRPKGPVTTAKGAVAGRRRARLAFERPRGAFAMAGTS